MKGVYIIMYINKSLELQYITNQDDPTIANKKFGVATISHSGCGIIASYNALISMGHALPFDKVLAYYNSRIATTLGFGLTGLLSCNIKQYFTSLGFRVVIANKKEQIDRLSKTADGCIMYYKFPRMYRPLGISFNAYGAHFIEYSKTDGGYIGHNTSENSGSYKFANPSDYGNKSNRYGMVGIFIFKK